jgi:endonuclease VIII-like 1
VLEPLAKQEHEEDLLSLCHTVPKEVVDLKQTLGKSETAVVTEEDYRALAKQEHEEDLLSLCHTVPKEVVDLKQTLGKSETAVVTEEDYRAFCQWLKCYENPAMNTAKDHNGRTIWFKGEAGSMCPKCKM